MIGALLAAVAVFIMGVALDLAIYNAFCGRRRLSDARLVEPGYRQEPAAPLRGAATAKPFVINWLVRRSRLTEQPADPTVRQRRTLMTLSHAGFNGTDTLVVFRLIWLVATVGGALLGLSLGALYGNYGPPIAVLGGVLGYILPVRLLRRMARRRQLRISRDLPATLDLLLVCLEAGLGLAEALRTVSLRAERRRGVFGSILATMNGELNAGLPLSDALRNLADRTGSEDLQSVAALLIQSEQTGTRLAPALRASAEQFAARRRMHAEERAQQAAVKMLLPLVLLILPALLLVVLGPAVLKTLRVIGG